MDQQGGIKQPLLGLLGTVIVFFVAFGIIIWFKTETFLTWAGYLAMTLIPFSIIIGLVWRGDYPAPAARMAASRCSGCGVQMVTAWTPASRSMRSTSV